MSRKYRGRQPNIDWEQAKLLHNGIPEEDPDPEPEEQSVPHNEFTRKITGFSPAALELLLRYGFSALDDRGFVPVRFIGVSRKPDKTIDYKNPTLLRSREGLVVLSGVVDKKSVGEVGNGSYPIEHVERPDVEDHNSPRRLNVSLGEASEDFDPDAAIGELDRSELEVSAVDSINGTPITSDLTQWEIRGLWHRDSSSYMLGN